LTRVGQRVDIGWRCVVWVVADKLQIDAGHARSGRFYASAGRLAMNGYEWLQKRLGKLSLAAYTRLERCLMH
jgi:hypothetical protein